MIVEFKLHPILSQVLIEWTTIDQVVECLEVTQCVDDNPDIYATLGGSNEGLGSCHPRFIFLEDERLHNE